LAALILSVNPDLTSAEVKRTIMDTADKIDQANGEYVDGHSIWYGHGRINAQKAVALAAGTGDGGDSLPETLFMEHRVNKAIPDLGTTEDIIIFPLDVVIKEIEVSVDIRHTYRGDLRLTIKSPQGQNIVLIDRSGGGEDNIIQSYRSTDEPGLFDAIIGNSAKGNWSLKIEDMAKQDVGVLTKWGLTITYLS
jgi:hypothetical protein